MIITVTCNPAIDKTVYGDTTVFDIGGKGINVSKVLKKLNMESIVTGFIGKDNKDLVIDDLNRLGINNHFIEVEGRVRTNTKIITNNELIEKNEDGPQISDEKIDELFTYLKQFNNEIVVISGSAPKKCRVTIYLEMIELLKENYNFVILDCSGDLFKEAIKAKPNIIKPNKDEICNYFNCDYNQEDIIDRCKKLDIELVCLSLGDQGAIFIKDKVYRCKPLNIKYASSVGAGDAMVGALAYGKANSMGLIDTIKLAMACASAACETKGTKAPEYKDIEAKICDSFVE